MSDSLYAPERRVSVADKTTAAMKNARYRPKPQEDLPVFRNSRFENISNMLERKVLSVPSSYDHIESRLYEPTSAALNSRRERVELESNSDMHSSTSYGTPDILSREYYERTNNTGPADTRHVYGKPYQMKLENEELRQTIAQLEELNERQVARVQDADSRAENLLSELRILEQTLRSTQAKSSEWENKYLAEHQSVSVLESKLRENQGQLDNEMTKYSSLEKRFEATERRLNEEISKTAGLEKVSAESEKKMQGLHQSLKVAEERQRQLQGQVTVLTAEKETQQERIASLESEVDLLEDNVADSDRDVKEMLKEMETLKQENEALNKLRGSSN